MTQAAVVGCGIMGSGITFVARAAGFPVTAVEPTDELLAAAGFGDLADQPPDSVLFSPGVHATFGQTLR